jgi:hypothetical protein
VNALAATDINLFPAALAGYTYAEIATEMQSRIRAAGAATVTVTWDGAKYVITAPGATGITGAAHSTGVSLTSELFGGTTDQDAVATTWTGAAPAYLSSSGKHIEFVLAGGLAAPDPTDVPRVMFRPRNIYGAVPDNTKRYGIVFECVLYRRAGSSTDADVGVGYVNAQDLSGSAAVDGQAGAVRAAGATYTARGMRIQNGAIVDASPAGVGSASTERFSAGAFRDGSNTSPAFSPIRVVAETSAKARISAAASTFSAGPLDGPADDPWIYVWAARSNSTAGTVVTRIGASLMPILEAAHAE